MSRRRRVSPKLVALSSAAILAVYGAGYAQTQMAADEIARQQEQPLARVLAAPAPRDPLFERRPTDPQRLPSVPNQDGANGFRVQPPIDDDEYDGEHNLRSSVVGSSSLAIAVATVVSEGSLAVESYRDGTFTGIGYGIHGAIEATVVIQNGVIISAEITDCMTRYPCSQIARLPGEVLRTQALPVTRVSGATESSKTYRDAIRHALAEAM